MGFPFAEIARSILATALSVVWSPAVGLRLAFYWVLVAVVWGQYRRTAAMQTHLYGQAKSSPTLLTLIALAEGLAVGFAGSYLSTFFGVSFLPDGSGLLAVLLVSAGLLLVSPRLMCFSYAGGLVSLSYLIFGFPRVSVPDLMGLVAILHLMESLLILTNGWIGATPVYLERKGRPVGAFYLQRGWPVPVALLILAVVSPAEAAQGIAMPEWWPLLRTSPEILAHPGAVFFLHALPAALGYSDLAMTCPPRLKARRTSAYLAVYSVVLLLLCLMAARSRPLVWVTALFAPLGHELVVRLGNLQETRGRPFFVPPEEGVMVLDVIPGSPAAGAGLGPGWVIREVDGCPVTGRDELEAALRRAGQDGRVELLASPPEYRRRTTRRLRPASGPPASRRLRVPFGQGGVLGVIPVPEPGDDMGLVLTTASPLRNLWRRLAGGRDRGRGG